MAQKSYNDVAPLKIPRGEGRDALCGALCRVVAREGFDGVTYRSVAAEAGVTHGLASYHFGSREAMINEALTWAVRRALESPSLASSVTGIDDFATDLPRTIGENPEEAVFQYDVLLRALRTPELLDSVRRSYDEYIEAVDQRLRTVGIANDALAALVFAALDGLTLQQLLFHDERRTRDAIDVLRQLLHSLSEHTASSASRDAAAS